VENGSGPLSLTVIEHPEGPERLFPFGFSNILVTEIFETFWNLLESEDMEWQKLLQSPRLERFSFIHHATIVTGQPGIGQYAVIYTSIILTYRILYLRKDGLSDIRTFASTGGWLDHHLLRPFNPRSHIRRHRRQKGDFFCRIPYPRIGCRPTLLCIG
jgi:hypothetical protein